MHLVFQTPRAAGASGAEAQHDVTNALLSTQVGHRLLDDAVPAIGWPGIRTVLPLLRTNAADNQPIRGTCQLDVKQATMLFEVAFLFAGNNVLERRLTLFLPGTKQWRHPRSFDLHVDGEGFAPKPRGVRSSVRKDHHRRFEPLGAVYRHHPHLVR